jgi:hypothetical protein
LTETCVLLATGLLRHQGVETECLGICGALPRGRTECVPPRKPPLTPSPGLAPGGHLSSDGRLRGGAGSARPQGTLPFHRGIVPRRHRAFDCPLHDHVMPRLPYGLATRTRRPRPSEKIAFRVIPGSSPQGHPCWASPPRRGGLRTPAGKVLAPFGHVPVGDPAPPGRTVKTELLATRLAIPCGRTECVSPRNRLSRDFRALPRKAILARMADSAEGRAPHARKGGIGLAETCPR